MRTEDRRPKTESGVIAVLACLLSSFIFTTFYVASPSSFGQGALTPPGAPAPTMKTLEQVEPRTPISSVPFTISLRGSFYLTTNLTCVACTNSISGISVEADHVTIDLGGFALIGIPDSGFGITVESTQTNLVVRNGTVGGWGESGLNVANASGSRFERLQLVGNAGGGIVAGLGSTVSECTAENNPSPGIAASGGCLIVDCTARRNNQGISVGHGTVVSRCVAYQNVNDGILASDGSLVIGCVSRENGTGISLGNGSAVIDCTVTLNTGHGINLVDGNLASRNTCFANGVGATFGAGIRSASSSNRIEDNNLVSNDAGIRLESGGNIVIRNTAKANPSSGAIGSSNFVISAGNTLGPTNNLVDATTGIITNAHPWANFSY